VVWIKSSGLALPALDVFDYLTGKVKATITVKVQEDETTNRIPINRGVRQSYVFRRLNWDKRCLRVDGRYLSNLRFADDIVLISSTKEELIEMLA